jgi:uncharacterized protein with PIN domain
MLGKLARWLRMMGHDTKYSTTFDDEQLICLAKLESRILLTRDLALYQQTQARDIQGYYVEGNTEPERIAELTVRFGIPLEINLAQSRCPKCNTTLTSISKEEIAGKLEKNTLLYYNQFWTCPKCGAVYWQGAHWTKIRATLDEAKQKIEKKDKV